MANSVVLFRLLFIDGSNFTSYEVYECSASEIQYNLLAPLQSLLATTRIFSFWASCVGICKCFHTWHRPMLTHLWRMVESISEALCWYLLQVNGIIETFVFCRMLLFLQLEELKQTNYEKSQFMKPVSGEISTCDLPKLMYLTVSTSGPTKACRYLKNVKFWVFISLQV
jgi:hypothetical protein